MVYGSELCFFRRVERETSSGVNLSEGAISALSNSAQGPSLGRQRALAHRLGPGGQQRVDSQSCAHASPSGRVLNEGVLQTLSTCNECPPSQASQARRGVQPGAARRVVDARPADVTGHQGQAHAVFAARLVDECVLESAATSKRQNAVEIAGACAQPCLTRPCPGLRLRTRHRGGRSGSPAAGLGALSGLASVRCLPAARRERLAAQGRPPSTCHWARYCLY